MASGVVAGVDCSTQSTKVIVVDVDEGEVVARGHAPHRVEGEGGARETDPDVWWEALRDALAQTGRAGDVEAISVAGQQHGLVCLDGDGAPLAPAPLWNDTRAASDAEDLLGARSPQWWADRVGSVPLASFTVSKWAWLRRTERTIAQATASIHLPHDYLTWRLCGAHVTDRGDASGTGWWSPTDEAYEPDVLDLDQVDLDPDLLPRVLGPREAAGEVTSEAAAELGLAPGIPVGPGTGDNMGAALGLGLGEGTPTLSLGTSGTVYVVSTTPTADPSGVLAGFADATGSFLPLACTLNCTQAVDRFAQWLGLDRDAVEDGGRAVVLPYLDGERTPNLPDATGLVTGLRHDTTPGQLLLAVYEGAVASLLDAVDALEEHASSVDRDAPIVLIGGGARGTTWRRTVRRLSGRAVLLPAAEELVAIGAAAQSAAVLTGEEPAQVARRWDTRAGDVLEAVEPDTTALERIRRTRERARELLDAPE